MSGTEKTTKQTQLSYWWSEYQWTIIGLLALTAFTLGLLGFFQYFSAKSEVRTSQDILYLTLQLFTLDSGAVTGPVPWSLEIARLLAPALLVYTAAKALLEIFHEQVQVFRARFAKNHVIICGLGRKGYLLARSFREAGFQVVAIELDKEKVKAVQAHRNGIIVLNGNVSDKERLRRVRVDRAAYLFSVCGDDGVNAEVAVHSRKLIKDLEGKGLTCFIHIDNNGLSGLLREREISTQHPDAFRLELFNIHERGARALLSAFQPFTSGSEDEGINHSLLVIGA
ncbi:MAG: NAD-binding protein, partial [Candidatus Thiodiazotropha sp. (ex Notomyrtea botanica)]|nr:NAD-binding protein [Candidatus Thiodiazotropha sp. (ex Notomyrtea botanica)]